MRCHALLWHGGPRVLVQWAERQWSGMVIFLAALDLVVQGIGLWWFGAMMWVMIFMFGEPRAMPGVPLQMAAWFLAPGLLLALVVWWRELRAWRLCSMRSKMVVSAWILGCTVALALAIFGICLVLASTTTFVTLADQRSTMAFVGLGVILSGAVISLCALEVFILAFFTPSPVYGPREEQMRFRRYSRSA